MFNKDFLQKLTILFVEDDEIARHQLSRMLNRLFKKVITAKNGLEGYEIYQEERLVGNEIDLILSDINMPIMNGLEMLEKIRIHDSSTPVIFTTARTETEYLLKAISLGVEHYAIKPIDIEDVVNKIEIVCEKKYYKKVIKEKSTQLEEYLKVINNVASIYKMKEDGTIISTNSLLLQLLAYSEEKEIINKNFNDIIASDIDRNIVNDLWKTIKTGQTWNDDLKYRDKNNKSLYIKSTIFKTTNDEKVEYISIGFDSTEDVNKKREFHKKLMLNMKDKNIEISESQKDLKKYELIINKLQEDSEHEKQKQADFASQIKFYENELKNVDERILKNLKIKNHEIEELKDNIRKIKLEKEINFKNMESQNEALSKANLDVDNLNDKVKRDGKRIEDLLDLVKVREIELKKYKKDFE
jgi:CheY-like chemotaxis protein